MSQNTRIINIFKKFLNNGCKFKDFTKSLYQYLVLNCNFIAHFDIKGFYNTYFTSINNFNNFSNQLKNCNNKNSTNLKLIKELKNFLNEE